MLEEKFIYRLIKVLYYLGLGIALIFSFYLLLHFYFLPDNRNSYIICDDGGKQYSLREAGVRFDSGEYDLTSSKHNTLLHFCIKKGGNIYKLTNLEHGKPRWTDWNEGVLHIAYKPIDLPTYMGDVFVISLLLLIYSLVLTVVRELMLYVIYGKKFSINM